jgi:hypothetical protein
VQRCLNSCSPDQLCVSSTAAADWHPRGDLGLTRCEYVHHQLMGPVNEANTARNSKLADTPAKTCRALALPMTPRRDTAQHFCQPATKQYQSLSSFITVLVGSLLQAERLPSFCSLDQQQLVDGSVKSTGSLSRATQVYRSGIHRASSSGDTHAAR